MIQKKIQGSLLFSAFFLLIRCSVKASAELSLGTFATRFHDLQGEVFALSDRVLEVRNMVYDGLGPDAYFWADTNPIPSINGVRLSDGAPSKSCGTEPLPEARSETFRFEFPEGMSIHDYIGGSISVWCETATANFGEVIIDANIDLTSLPTLALGDGPSFECGALTVGSFTTRAHDLEGQVVALSDRVMEVRNFVYDGLGPAAYFWADTNSVPSSGGFRLLDASPSNSCGKESLPEGRQDTFRFEFPNGMTIHDIVGGSISVWCEAFSANFGEVIVDSPALGLLPTAAAGGGPQLECAALTLGSFTNRAHDLAGEVVALSDRVMEVRNFNYDGLGPAAYFWADASAVPSSGGFRLLDASPSNSCGTERLPEARQDTFRFEFPDGMTIHDIDGGSISVWCEAFSANFGEVVVNTDLALASLPAAANGGGPSLECGQAAPSLAPTPPGYNCEELSSDFQVRWRVENNNEIKIELIGRIDDDGYMGFGVSGDESRALMVGGDPVVADFFGGQPRARDFYMSDRAQCSVETGVCPDTAGSFSNDIISNSVSGDRQDGLTLVRFSRPVVPSNVDDETSGYAVDQAIKVQPGDLTSVIWALGPLDRESGNPFFHSIGFSRDLIQFDFGRRIADNCSPLTTEDDDEEEIFPFLRPVLKDVTEFHAVIGPSGGDRGYASIALGRTPWGIAWYLNGKLSLSENQRGLCAELTSHDIP